MAEVTPTTWDVLTDKLGGLRRVADTSNRQISKWYADEWFMSANIVAVDFYRGTNLMETAIYSNLKKDLLRRSKKWVICINLLYVISVLFKLKSKYIEM